MIIVDTSVWIDFFKGINNAQRHTLHHLIEKEEAVSITEIILTEILQGIKKEVDFQTTMKYLLQLPIHRPKGIDTYLNAASIYRDCRSKGKTIRRTTDCLIASICIEKDLSILHNDTDFDSIAACTSLKIFRMQ